MGSIAIDRLAGSELDIAGIRPLTPQEIELVSGAWNWQEALIVTTGGAVAGAAGGAASTWYLGTGVLAGAASGFIGGAAIAFVAYAWNDFYGGYGS